MIELNNFVSSLLRRRSDAVLVKRHPVLEQADHFLRWDLKLKGAIVPDRSSYLVKKVNLELKLYKACAGEWGSVEAVGTSLPPARNGMNE